MGCSPKASEKWPWTCDALIQLWFRVPHPHSHDQGSLGLGPALALLTAGLEHPEAEHARGEAYESSSEDFGCACCQDDVATITLKVPCGWFLPHCLFVELFTLTHLPQQSALSINLYSLQASSHIAPCAKKAYLCSSFALFYGLSELHPFQKGLCSPIPI